MNWAVLYREFRLIYGYNIEPVKERSAMRFFASALMFALLILSGCGGGETVSPKPDISGAPPGLNVSLARDLLLAEINKSRTEAGLSRVEFDATAMAVAQAHADEMASNAYFSHFDLSGLNPVERYAAAGGWEPAYENAWRGPGLDALDAENVRSMHNGFMQSEPHRENVLSASHTHVGIGFQYDKTSKSLYGVEVFIDRVALGASLSDYTLAAGQFTDFFLAFDPAKVRFEEIVVAMRNLPTPKSPDWLNVNRTYSLPSEYIAIYVENSAGGVYLPGATSRRSLNYDRSSGIVEGEVRIEPGWTEGLYYFYVWGSFIETNEKVLLAILVAHNP